MIESAPLLPLPGHVLLPGLPVPLHVFEPRYRVLIHDLLDLPVAERWLAVPRIRPGHETEAIGRPPLCEVVAAVRLATATSLPDGRFLIAVIGEGRWRLHENLSPHAYRLARLERLPDPDPPLDFTERVATAVRRHLGPVPAVPDEVICLLDPQRHPALEVLDRLAALMLVDPNLRQRYLEAQSACCRIRVLEGAESSCGGTATTTLN